MAHYQIEAYLKSVARKVRFDVVIPSLNLQGCLSNKDDNYYSNLDKKYPLALFFHGFGDDEKGWQNNSQIIKLCEENNVAGCFINGENKWYLKMGAIDDFYNLIEKDILDFLYGNFSSLSKDMPLAVCGVSMGGYGALYHYLNNLDKYYCAVSLSPATKPDYMDESYSLRSVSLAHTNEKLNVYLSVGENDFIIKASKELDEFFENNNIDIRYKYIPNANHSWSTWSNEVFNVFEYFKQIKFIK